jgi:uncharacterized protein involved in exopolysaccharide biosynthesis
MAESLQFAPRFDSFRRLTAREIATILFRHKRLFMGIFLLIFIGGVAYAILMPSYRAEMKLLVRRGRIDPALTPTQTVSPAFDHEEISEEEMNSEMEFVRDDSILREVVLETGLAEKPLWLSSRRNDAQEARTQMAVQRLAKKLDVLPVRKSRLITIAYSSGNPELSAAVLRRLSDAYIKKHAEMRRPSGQQTFFETQMQQARRALDAAQRRLMDFSRKNGIVSAELERDLMLQKLSEAEAGDLAARASIAEATERTHVLESKLSNLPERRVVQVRNTDNQQLQEKLKSKLLELELRRTELLTKFQPSYRLVQEVEDQIKQTKSAIQAEELKPLRDETTEQDPEYQWAHSEALKSQVELDALEERHVIELKQIFGYRHAAQKLGENAIIQHDLEQNLKAAEDKYLLYVNKREEARIGDSLDQNGMLNVTVAEAPHVPVLPLWPLWSSTFAAMFGAMAVGTGCAFAADYLDPSLRCPEDVMQVLGTPVLAALPKPAAEPKGTLKEL